MQRGTGSLADWRSYDGVARSYDDVWGHRFEEAARHIWARIPLPAGAALLDIGTGTGIVPRALGARLDRFSRLIGCDRSQGMLSEARTRIPQSRVVAADARQLPFADAVFDVVTASFVLSHLPDHRPGLMEAHRVLKPSGTFAMASWAAKTDPHREAWSRLLEEVVPASRLQEASGEVAPSEAFFESAENVSSALTEAGFATIEVRSVVLRGRLSLERFLADRELSSSGRFARHAMGQAGWRRFLANAREELARSFGTNFGESRRVLIGLGRRE